MELVSEKPPGSVIQEREEAEGLTLFWSPPGGNWFRFPIAAFLAFWLCAWAAGWVFAFRGLLQGGFQLFLVVWLAGWTVGGGFALWVFWQIVRPPRPESIQLRWDSFRYDPGRSLISRYLQSWSFWHTNPSTAFTNFFKRSKPMDMAKSVLKAFVLERVGERQRLTFDDGADRIEIGLSLREPEREWLFKVLEKWRTA